MATAGNRGNKSVAEEIKMVTLVTDREICLSVTNTSNVLAIILMPDVGLPNEWVYHKDSDKDEILNYIKGGYEFINQMQEEEEEED